MNGGIHPAAFELFFFAFLEGREREVGGRREGVGSNLSQCNPTSHLLIF